MQLQTLKTKLDGGIAPVFGAGATSGQKTERINEVLERIHSFDEWKGSRLVLDNLQTTDGILTLAEEFGVLLGLSEPGVVSNIPIKSMEWEFRDGGYGGVDWTESDWPDVAIDMGFDGVGQVIYAIPSIDFVYLDTTKFSDLPTTDPGIRGRLWRGGDFIAVSNGPTDAISAGRRKYRISGDPTTNDARVFRGLVRRRFVAVSADEDLVYPDNVQAIKLGCLALRAEDEGDIERSEALFNRALTILNRDLTMTSAPTDLGRVQMETLGSLGEVENIL